MTNDSILLLQQVTHLRVTVMLRALICYTTDPWTRTVSDLRDLVRPDQTDTDLITMARSIIITMVVVVGMGLDVVIIGVTVQVTITTKQRG